MSMLLVSILGGGTTTGGGETQLATPSISVSQAGIDDAVVIDWVDISGATSYQVQRSTSPTTGFVTIGTPSASTFSDSDVLVNGTTYYYRVKAIGAGYLDSAYGTGNISYLGSPSIPFDLDAATAIVVDKTGTIGVDCDFNTLTDALDSITDNDSSHTYKILVIPGTYPEDGFYNVDIDLNVGMYLKHYVHILGQGDNPEDVLITGPEAAPAFEGSADVFHIPATCLVQNVKVQAHNMKYAFHLDHSLYDYDLYIKDCKIEHLGSVSDFQDGIGIGIYGNQRITIINTEVLTGTGIYAHGNASTVRDADKHWEIELFGCNITAFRWQDYIEYVANKITLTNNSIDNLYLQTITVIYDANPGNPLCNTGTKVFTTFENDGNSVDALSRDAETIAILGTTMDSVDDFN